MLLRGSENSEGKSQLRRSGNGGRRAQYPATGLPALRRGPAAATPPICATEFLSAQRLAPRAGHVTAHAHATVARRRESPGPPADAPEPAERAHGGGTRRPQPAQKTQGLRRLPARRREHRMHGRNRADRTPPPPLAAARIRLATLAKRCGHPVGEAIAMGPLGAGPSPGASLRLSWTAEREREPGGAL